MDDAQFIIKESKFDYFFGRVNSSPANQRRSIENLENLRLLGIDEASGGKERLLEIFSEGLTATQVGQPYNSRYGVTVVRRVEMNGIKTGAIEISYFYPNGNFDTIPEISTIIVKIYRE